MDRDALVARLRRAFGGDTPRDASHDSAALEAAARLERAARPDDVEAWALIALLYWQRCLATPHGSEREYTSAAALTRSLRPALDPLPTRLPMPTSDPVVLVASCADHVADLLSRRAFKVMEQPGFATDAAAQTQAAAVLGEASMLTRALGPSALAIYGNLGAVLMARYRATGQVAHLDQAVAAWRRAVAAPGTRQDVVAVTSNLATGYEARYEVRGRAVDLDRAVEARRRAAAMAGGDRSLHLIALAEDLRRRHARTGSARDADDAVCSAEAALAAAVTPEERRVCAQKLAAVLTARYDLSHARADLDRSIEVMGDAVMQDAGSGSPKIPGILGLALFQRFKDFESVADLDTAIDVLRGASLSGDGANLGFLLVALGDALRARYQLSSRLADLDEAITVGRRAVADDVADPEALGEPRADLSMSFRLRFERTADPADLDQAVEFGEAGVAVTPPGHTDRARRLAAAGIALALRGHTRGELSDIDRGLEYIRAVILPAPSTERPGQLSNLASALLWRFFLLRQREDLDAAAEAIRAAVEALPLDRSKTAVALTNLNGITAARFDDSGAPAVLDEAVDLIRRVLRTLTPTDPICPEVAEGLADALLGRHRHGGGDGDAEERLELLRYVATATPPGDVRVGGRWQALGDALSTRYHRTGGSADLDETIDAMRHAVDSTGLADPALPLRFAWLGTMLTLRSDRAGVDNDLREAEILARRVADLPAGTGEDEDVAFQETFVANALLSAFERQGLLADIDAAVKHARRAVELLPVGEESPERLGTLGVALCTRWERTGASADLDEAVAMCRKALTVQSPDDEAYAGRLVNLGSALRLRYRRDGNGADLDEAVDLLQRATATAAPERQRSALSALSLALHARFEHAGQIADVDAAVVAIREAVARTPADNPALAGYLSNLGYVVQRRYEHIGRGADLDSAVEACRAAVATTPVDHPDHALYLGNLFPALLRHFYRDQSRAELDEAVGVIHRCVDLTPPDSAQWADRRSGVAAVLFTRFETYGNSADLDEAISVAREVIDRVSPSDPELSSHLHGLNIMLRHRYLLRGDERDIAEAVEVAETSVDMLTADHPERAGRLFDLANTRRARLHRQGDPTDHDRALSEFRAGAQVQTASPAARVKCGRQWARMAAERGEWDEAGAACALVLELVPQLVSHALDFGDRRRHIEELQGLGQLAARAAIERTGSADDAWVMLEAGRGVLLGQALGVRSDLAELRAAEPDLADQVLHLRVRLNAPSPADGRADQIATVLRPLTEDRRELVERWQELMETIRSRQGFQRFGLPPTADELRPAAAGGLIVAVSISGTGCDALILTETASDRLELPGLTEERVIEQANRILRALRPPAGEKIDTSSMHDVLEWMWDTIAEPVLRHLGLTAPPEPGAEWPRMWWIPTGALTVLPLHAAGHHRDPASGQSVLDRVVSSYTPTVRMLLHAHRPARPPREALAVGINRTSDDRVPALHMAEREATTVHELLAGRPPLLGERATRAAVRSALPEAAWIHLACHALSDRADPARSHLTLADGPITVGDLFEVDVPDGYLAYLSACDTATTPLSTLDEAIHIAAAFQIAGYPHTVATLWPISDLLAPDIAYRIYEAVLHGATPAHAVHRAVRDLRGRHPDAPHRWASHVHFGP
ncbi:CHAT domain-containing protein [Micromonospora sp. NPDC127501]|uniref:CHAT domain-containing protein n=1 Tax=Micromonospora sp. NPDC127501 TaxID=3154872 RepID=UPI00331C3F5B